MMASTAQDSEQLYPITIVVHHVTLVQWSQFSDNAVALWFNGTMGLRAIPFSVIVERTSNR
jgi:hypothetical protein